MGALSLAGVEAVPGVWWPLGIGGQHQASPVGGIAPPPGSCPLLPLLGISGAFLCGAGSPGIPSCSPPLLGREEEEERAAVLIKDEDTATNSAACSSE